MLPTAIAGRARTRALFVVLGLAALAAALDASFTTPDAAGEAATTAVGTRFPAAAAAATGDAAEPEIARLEVPALPEPGPERTFVERIDDLVAMNLDVARLAESGAEAAAIERDHEVREAFGALMREVPDADHLALAELLTPTAGRTEMPTSPALAGVLRRSILSLAVGTGLFRRHAESPGGTERSVALTSGILTALQARSDLAEPLGSEVLAGKPYLGPAHETQVLDLVAASGDGTFPVVVATELLSTLWQNLKATGGRASERLAGLALLLLEQGNTSERLAASRLLLVDARYRDVLLARLRESGDRDLARAVAMAAAQELPPTEAFAVLTTTAAIVGQDLSPFLTLAMRAPELLVREYEERLGSDVEPRVRALLVSGAGFAKTPESLELAQLALGQDPDPDVRLRALFVLTGAAAATLGEAAIQQALDDPGIGNHPERLGAVVLALQNLARAGQANAVERLGQRLRATAGLSESSRELLEQVLRESLPGRVASANGISTSGSESTTR